jgi:hypothetical protein
MALLSLWLHDRQSVRKWRPHSNQSVVTVQREFRRRYGTEPPGAQSIRRLYRQFEETGCLCKGKSTGRPSVTNDMLERVWKEFEYRLDVARVTRRSHIEHL